MKYLQLFEAWKPLIEIKHKDGTVLRYKEEWKTPRSKERNDLTRYLMDIFQELIDDRYRVHDGGWMASNDYPYIWISSRRRREGMDWDVVDDCVARAIDYLESNGFVTEVEKINVNSSNAQMNLFFDKKPTSVNESNKLDDLNDCFLNIQDDGYSFDIREIKANPFDFSDKEKFHSDEAEYYELDNGVEEMIEVRISKESRTHIPVMRGSFELSDIQDSIEMSIGLAGDMGYRVDSFLSQGEFLLSSRKDYYHKDMSSLPDEMYKLYITFVKETKETNESVDSQKFDKRILMDSFQSIEDVIGHGDPGSGVKINDTTLRDRKYGGTPEGQWGLGSVTVTILPKMFTAVDIEREMTGDLDNGKSGWDEYKKIRKSKQYFKELDYSAAQNITDEFFNDVIDCMYHAEGVNDVKISRVVIAWKNGGETGGAGELIKGFKVGGGTPNEIQTGLKKGSYDIEYLPTFLKERIKDRLSWIKIYYDVE